VLIRTLMSCLLWSFPAALRCHSRHLTQTAIAGSHILFLDTWPQHADFTNESAGRPSNYGSSSTKTATIRKFTVALEYAAIDGELMNQA